MTTKKSNLLQRFKSAEIPFRASALSFHTLLSIVPIIALIFWFLQSIGITEKWIHQLQNYIMSHLDVSSGEFFIEKLNRLALSVSGSSWGTVGLVIFIFTAGNIVTRLGSSLDKILGTAPVSLDWTQSALLTMFQRFLVLLCLPIVFLSSFLIAEWFKTSSWVHYLLQFKVLSLDYFKFLPWVLDYLGIFSVYRFIPQHKVSFYEAARAALWVVLVYEFTKSIFTQYNHYAITTHKIYGAFSAIPIFFLWIYIAWILLLSGALLIRVPEKISSPPTKSVV